MANNLQELFKTDMAFRSIVVEVAARAIGSTSEEFAEEWLMMERQPTSVQEVYDEYAPKLSNDTLGAKKVVSTESVDANDANAASLKDSSDDTQNVTDDRETAETSNNSDENITDSREKLETDIAYEFSKLGFNVHIDEVFGWLDRQAAITEREKAEKVYAQSRSTEYLHELKQKLDDITNERNMLQRRNSELRTQYDKLKRERDYWREQMLNCVIAACRPGGYTKGVMDYPRGDEYAEPSLLVTDAIECTRDFNADVARLTAERENEKRELEKERDYWRNKCGDLLDVAHDMQLIADDLK